MEEGDVALLAQMVVVWPELLEFLHVEVCHRVQQVELLADSSWAVAAVEDNKLFADAAVVERDKAGLDILDVDALLDYFHMAQVGRDTEREVDDLDTAAAGHKVIATHCRDWVLEASLQVCTDLADSR